MSLSAIQDNLVKTNIVQQHQARGDEVGRTQEVAQAAAQAEQNRQGDQVVLMTQHAEQQGIRQDAERERREEEEKKRKRRDEDDEETPEEETSANPHAEMHRINIVV